MSELADRADREHGDEIDQRQRAKREAVDDAAERKRPDNAADLQHRADQRRHRHRGAEIVENRGQPVRQEIEIEQAHEEHHPQQQRDQGSSVPEQMQHRNALQGGFVHDEPGIRIEPRFRIDVLEQFGDAPLRPPGKDQEPDRFRQPQRQDRRQQQRRDATDDKHRTPAEMRNQRRGKQTAERGSHRKAAEHDHHHGGAAAARIEFGHHRNGVRHRTAEAEPGQEPDREQRVDAVDERRDQRADAECKGRENNDLLASDPVGQRPEQQGADHQPEQACAEHRAERGLGQTPFLGERGRDIADRLGVEAVEKQHRRASQQQPDLESADRLPVDELDDIDRR